ncbi:MAG: formate C-acetyltransferase/glycerol dehydratase family glycyl radical enzyme, partial [Oligoflexales bacterium]|nr:formate C-acetyltransferase/glycerol dehydratase family glycyl radical enzyme [Oligoflexales bacterium]
MRNDRIKILRDQSLAAIPSISTERALLLTEFYRSENSDLFSIPLQRAMAFKYILENKKLCVNDGELIVGERGPSPKATPTYPEICLHSITDLEIISGREKIPYHVSKDGFDDYSEKIIPFWKGRSMRDKIFRELDDEWKNAYEAGIFTEFLEQRAPGHTVLGDKIYKMGLLDIKKQVEETIGGLDFFNDIEAYDKREELRAMSICIDALLLYAGRYEKLLLEMAKNEKDPERARQLNEMAEVVRSVPAHKPATFRQALQYYWFAHIGVITELNPWDSFNPGRLDQHLYPFYRKGLEDGSLTEESARELLSSFWVKFNNHPAPPKMGVTALESNTYTDFALINLGGLTAEGLDGVNELTYLILDVIEDMRILQPSSMIQVSKKSPDRFVRRALKIIKTGFGQPSIFNTDEITAELLRQGKSIEDARRGGASGCVETGAFGHE